MSLSIPSILYVLCRGFVGCWALDCLVLLGDFVVQGILNVLPGLSLFTLVFICIFVVWLMGSCDFCFSCSGLMGDRFFRLSLMIFGGQILIILLYELFFFYNFSHPSIKIFIWNQPIWILLTILKLFSLKIFYWPHLYRYTRNLSADMSFGLLQVSHVELGSSYTIWNWTLNLNPRGWIFHVKFGSPHRISNWTLYLKPRGRIFPFC